jgi:hypothetical protein
MEIIEYGPRKIECFSKVKLYTQVICETAAYLRLRLRDNVFDTCGYGYPNPANKAM